VASLVIVVSAVLVLSSCGQTDRHTDTVHNEHFTPPTIVGVNYQLYFAATLESTVPEVLQQVVELKDHTHS